MANSFTPAEFDCCECARHIIVVNSSTPPEPPLCGSCQFMPGWYRIAELREVLDPEHDGLEIWERAPEGSAP